MGYGWTGELFVMVGLTVLTAENGRTEIKRR